MYTTRVIKVVASWQQHAKMTRIPYTEKALSFNVSWVEFDVNKLDTQETERCIQVYSTNMINMEINNI